VDARRLAVTHTRHARALSLPLNWAGGFRFSAHTYTSAFGSRVVWRCDASIYSWLTRGAAAMNVGHHETTDSAELKERIGPRYWLLQASDAASGGSSGGTSIWSQSLFDYEAELAPHEPVVHVSWYEAMAYCKWAGRRYALLALSQPAATLSYTQTQDARTQPWLRRSLASGYYSCVLFVTPAFQPRRSGRWLLSACRPLMATASNRARTGAAARTSARESLPQRLL
jgi:hypothetical protein